MTTHPTVLFICKSNAGKSQMAEALLRRRTDRVEAHSAGTAPKDAVNAESAASVAAVGADMSTARPKGIDPELLRTAQRVIILGSEAQVDPVPGMNARIERWETDEPSSRGITGAARMDLIRDDIKARVEALVDEIAPQNDVREAVRDRYAQAASSSCCGSPDLARGGVFGVGLYDEGERNEALQGSLGCGVPTQVADLAEGEVVLDLGSGAGGDVLISARRVGPSGKVYGLDMTDEMLEAARANAREAAATNVEFLKGYLEDIPLPDDSIDVALSNCVINLAADKRIVVREVARVLKPGGRIAFSDVVADADMPEDVRADMQAWTGCIAGALTADDFRDYLREAGFEDVVLTPTHAVHEHAHAALITARLRG